MQGIPILVLASGAMLAVGTFAPGCGDSKGGGSAHDGAVAGAGDGAVATGGTDGGTPADANCGASDGCGGSLVGTWRATAMASCQGGSPDCPGYTATGQFQPSGTFTFASDGSFSVAIAFTGTMELTYPLACLTTSTCTQLATNLGSPDASVSGTCVSNPSGNCVCTVNERVSTYGQGTYTTAGGAMTMIYAGATSTPVQADYCVQGSTLTLHFSSSTTYMATKE